MYAIRWLICYLSVFAFLTFLVPPLLTAAVIHVPGDQSTIQAGIDAAQDGDTVLVAVGIWVENIDFLGKQITVSSEEGPALTIIDGGSSGSVVTFAGGETRSALLQGFTITDGTGTDISGYLYGGGIICRLGSSPTISGNIVSYNYAEIGSGISCIDSSPRIFNNTISENTASAGGGISTYGHNCIPQIDQNTISENTANFAGGGIVCSFYSTPTLAGNTIRGNISAFEGGGINCQFNSSPLIIGNLITQNSSGDYYEYGGAGIVVWDQAFATITNNTITNNISGYEAGGVWIMDSGYALISGNNISHNRADYKGGGICFSVPQTAHPDIPWMLSDNARSKHFRIVAQEYSSKTGSPRRGADGRKRGVETKTVINNLVNGNIAGASGGIHKSDSGLVQIINNTIIHNTATSGAGGIGGESQTRVRNNIIRNNSSDQISAGIIATYCNVEGGWPGEGNIDADPLFVTGALGDNYLSQIAAGQIADSPCVDAGRPDSEMLFGTTRTDGIQDGDVIDMGFHYPLTDGIYIWSQPDSFEFNTAYPDGEPTPQNLVIWSCGSGLLEWSVSSEAEWLTLKPHSGSSTNEVDLVTVGIDMGAITPGEHQTTIKVLGIGALNSPQEIPVSIVVTHAGNRRLVVGPGPGYDNLPVVRVFRPLPGATLVSEFTAYGVPHFGVNVSTGDVDGDFISEILTGAGPGAVFGPHARGFDDNGTPLPGLSFMAYGTNKYGVNIAAGDLDADGFDEIITGAGPGDVFGPHVRGWNYDGTPGVTPVPGVSYFAYSTPKWGVNVAAGDIDGDSFDEIVTGAGPGAVFGPHVRGWNVDGGAAQAIGAVSFLAYGTNKYGVNVSCGDVDGDGIDELVTGPGPGGMSGAHVRGWNYDGDQVSSLPGFSFFAWNEYQFGTNVFAGADLNGDSRAELVVGCGPDPDAGTPVKVYLYDGAQVTEWFPFEAFPGLTHGSNVAAGRF